MAVWVAEAHCRQAVAGAEIVRYSSAAEVMGRVIVDSLGTAAMVQGAAAKGEKILSPLTSIVGSHLYIPIATGQIW